MADSNRTILCRVGALAAGVVLLARLACSVNVFSPTTDEPCHIGSAVSMVEAGKQVVPASHPPLARWVMAAPLWADGARLPQCRGMTTVGKEDLGYALGTQVLYREGLPYRKLLEHARLVMLVFPLAALGLLYLLAAHLVDERAACASVIFFSFEPTLLGHGFWLGNDVAACVGYLAGLLFGVRWIERPTRARAIAAGAAIGAAVGLKFSCLLLIPSLAVVGLLMRGNFAGMRRRGVAGQVAWAAVVAFGVLWGIYLFNVGPLGDQDVFGHPLAWERLPHWLLWTPIPMPSFLLGLGRLMAHNFLGHEAYLNGHMSSRGWWYYFPELLVVKSPVSFLAGLALAIGLATWRREWGSRPAVVIGAGAGVFLLLSMMGHIDLGIRYILPAIPLLYLFVVWQLGRGRWWAVLGILIVTTGLETAAVHPDYLAYFNFAVGGPARGGRLAIDSNLDWNQDLYRLAEEVHRHPPPQGYALRLTGQRNGPLLAALGLDPAAMHGRVHGKRLFISKDSFWLVGGLPWLAHHQPVGHVGYSIDVYDIPAGERADEPEDHPGPDEPRRSNE